MLFQVELPKLQRMPKGYVHNLQVSHLKSFNSSFAYSSFEPTGAPHTLNILSSTEYWATNFIMNLRNPYNTLGRFNPIQRHQRHWDQNQLSFNSSVVIPLGCGSPLSVPCFPARPLSACLATACPPTPPLPEEIIFKKKSVSEPEAKLKT